MRRRIISIATSGLCLVALSAMRFAAPGSSRSSSAVVSSAPAACTLLTAGDISKVLGVPIQPGQELGDATGCLWWSDPAAADTSRRVALNTHSLVAFNAAMRPAITTIQVEPASGIGDQAFYQIYPNNQNPFIWVKKGTSTFSVRIITRTDPKPFTLDAEKSKLATLAKAAVAKL